MAYSCSDFVEDVSRQLPDALAESDGEDLGELSTLVCGEIDRLQLFMCNVIKAYQSLYTGGDKDSFIKQIEQLIDGTDDPVGT